MSQKEELTEVGKMLMKWLVTWGFEFDEVVCVYTALETDQEKVDLMYYMADHRESTKSDVIGEIIRMKRAVDKTWK